MNKTDLISVVASKSKLTKTDASKVVDAMLESITKALRKKEEVRLVGFGTFSITNRAATNGRNPRTGAVIKIPAKRLPKFKAGKALREVVA
jgi:DNA-binding protein HU-beta